jgi:hypothetical protein
MADNYLLDTCSYLRLAQSLVPLFTNTFGNPEVQLNLIPDFEEEFDKSLRLATKFYWIKTEPHPSDRDSCPLKIFKGQKQRIKDNFKAVQFEARSKKLTTSYVDMMSLAIAMEFKYPLVTDDKDLRLLCEEFKDDIGEWIGSLDMLKLLLDRGAIDFKKVQVVVSYWIAMSDTPYKGWDSEYKSLFGEDPPKV